MKQGAVFYQLTNLKPGTVYLINYFIKIPPYNGNTQPTFELDISGSNDKITLDKNYNTGYISAKTDVNGNITFNVTSESSGYVLFSNNIGMRYIQAV